MSNSNPLSWKGPLVQQQAKVGREFLCVCWGYISHTILALNLCIRLLGLRARTQQSVNKVDDRFLSAMLVVLRWSGIAMGLWEELGDQVG